MSLAELRQVSKIYSRGGTRFHALHTVDLRIEQGEFIAIWGPSGSGKSTMCNLLALIDECDSGSVLFRGEQAGGLTDDQLSDIRLRHIGFIFQNFNLIPVLTAIENVMLPLQFQGKSAGQVRKKGLELLESLGLSEHADSRPDKLSGGQKQRVAIARALINDPCLVIADEPTANLDTQNAQAIIELMHRSNQEFGVSFVFSTHDQRLLSRVSRRVHLVDGTIESDETD